MLVSNEIKKWPINTGFMEEIIAGTESIDEASVAQLARRQKALQHWNIYFLHLLTTQFFQWALANSPQRMDYLVALAHNLASTSRELLHLWLPSGDAHADALHRGCFER